MSGEWEVEQLASGGPGTPFLRFQGQVKGAAESWIPGLAKPPLKCPLSCLVYPESSCDGGATAANRYKETHLVVLQFLPKDLHSAPLGGVLKGTFS